MTAQRLPGITTTRLLIVVIALAAASLAIWRVRSSAPAPESPYFPPGHMQIASPNREPEPERAAVASAPVSAAPAPATSPAPASATPALASPATASATSEKTPAPTAGEVQTAITAWKNAWESRDVDTYMMFYHPSFPDRGIFGRQKNGVMVRAKSIRVDVQDLKITVQQQRTRAVFVQVYESDTYQSRDVKTQVWINSADGPKIVEEFTRSKRGSEDE